MWQFFQRIGILDANGKFTEHVGDPVWVYYQYRLAKGDTRSQAEIYAEGQQQIAAVQARGCPLAIGHGANVWDLNPDLDKQIRGLYEDAKVSLWTALTPEFVATIPNVVQIATQSKDREDYVAHPVTGEKLSAEAVATLEKLRDSWAGQVPDAQIVISDGLNAKAIMDEGHLAPYLENVRKELTAAGFTVSDKHIVVTSGRVRAGYAIGDLLFAQADPDKPKVVLHVIGERPGTEHHNYSVYMAAPKAQVWADHKVDHDIAKVISGISDTAVTPEQAAKQTVQLVQEMIAGK